MTEVITDIKDSRIAVYHALLENQLKHIYEPEEGLFIAESPVVIERALDAGYVPESFLVTEEECTDEKARRIFMPYEEKLPVYRAKLEVLRKIPGWNLTRGLLCAMKRKPLAEAVKVLENARRVCVMEKVMNPTNAGSIFRNAAALGIDAVLLTPGCADPLYRRAARVSMGTVFMIPWTYIESALSVKEYGFKTVSMALRNDSAEISDERLKKEEKLAIMMGSEETGLLPETIEKSDYVVKIPMNNGVDSLNVTSASAVAFWELAKKL